MVIYVFWFIYGYISINVFRNLYIYRDICKYIIIYNVRGGL